MSTRLKLFDRITQNLAPGTLEWIGLRKERYGDVLVVDNTEALVGLGLRGDRRCTGTPGSARQVSIISQEHIITVAQILGIEAINPSLLRRNLVVSGININALRYQQFSIGNTLFEATAMCHPCSRMDKALGPGGHAAMLGHGGVCAKILKGGNINLGDRVIKIDRENRTSESAQPQGDMFSQ